jgi:glycosyltransferase involved in cell wall biosynthesis
MKICFISKYPPIEGGISSRTYWLAKALGERGHEVHIVTNAWEVEAEYREKINIEDLNQNYQPPNVYVHNTISFIDSVPVSVDPAYIPYANPYIAKLASLAIDIIEKYNLQLIDSWYILPYGISGFLAKTITGKPQIMRHAGSDLYRLLKYPYLRTLFLSLFKKVDKIVTGWYERKNFLCFNIPESKLFYSKIYNVNPKAFNPRVKQFDLSKYTNKDINGLPVITYIGKMGLFKGVYELVEAASKIKEDFLILFVTNGRGLGRFKNYIDRISLTDKVLFIGFLPPWQMPSIIKRSDCIVMLERDSPIALHFSILPKEVMSVGKCLIISKELYAKGYYGNISDGNNAIIVDPKNIQRLKEVLEKVIKEPSYTREIGKRAYLFSKKQTEEFHEHFDEFVDETVCLYKEILSSHKIKK